jgi:hypothetical protein
MVLASGKDYTKEDKDAGKGTVIGRTGVDRKLCEIIRQLLHGRQARTGTCAAATSAAAAAALC